MFAMRLNRELTVEFTKIICRIAKFNVRSCLFNFPSSTIFKMEFLFSKEYILLERRLIRFGLGVRSF